MYFIRDLVIDRRNVLLGLVSFIVLFVVIRIIYRIIWHPLASFPGPRLAAITNLYGAYYDLLLDGSLVKQLPRLHMEYGPVVRIAPNEIHVHDLESYHKIYKVGTEFDKSWEFYSARPIQGSLLAIPGTVAAKQRREAYNHHFSKVAIRQRKYILQNTIRRFVHVVESTAKEQRPVDLSRGFRCLTADIITKYAYQEDFGGLGSKDFKHPVIEAADDLTISGQWASYFRRTFAVLDAFANLLPARILGYLAPQLLATRRFEADCVRSIQKLKRPLLPDDLKGPTMFDIILNPDKNRGREVPLESDLIAEAVLVLLAGMDTTANTLAIGTRGVLRNNEIYGSLMEELRRAIPERESAVTVDTLGTLPYLGAVLKESLRLSYGVPGQLPRIVPSSGTTVVGIPIPAGTIISHSLYVYHNDETVFPNAMKFLPDRWLVKNTKDLEQRLLSFSRGSRACLGMHLANAELVFAFALMFRSLDMRLHETEAKDMEWGDYGVPLFRRHLKVTVNQSLK